MLKRSLLTREKLDGTVVDIEFLLIAVIQGLALTTLAVESEGVLGEGEFLYWPYVAAGFVLIMNFWSLAIIHSISFIRWPFDLVHTILYFLATFVEVAAFTQLTNPTGWFIAMFAFFVVSALLYLWDFRMIREKESEYQDTPERAALYRHIRERQHVELRYMLPGALIFHGAIVAVLIAAPALILEHDRHVWLVSAQLLFGLLFLAGVVRDFRVRERLITDCIEEESG
ncbi:MAG TPA: hypothetical protein VFK86_14845 [Bauldia sp.]|nr:hypothetical protein [Bauldia sp.]